MVNNLFVPKRKKVVLYCLSTVNKFMVKKQKIELLKFALEKRFSFDMYIETKSSNKTSIGKKELFYMLFSGEYSHLVFYKVEEFSLLLREQISDFQEIIDSGVSLIYLMEKSVLKRN